MTLPFLFALLLLTTLQASSHSSSRDYKQSAPNTLRKLQGHIRRVEMNTDSGTITITPGPKDQATVTASYKKTHCRDVVELEGETLRIENTKHIGGCPCDYTLVIPDSTDVKINTGHSTINVRDLDASLFINMGAGFVTLNTIRDVGINGGDVEGDITNIRDQVRLKLGISNVRVHFTELTERFRMIDLSAGTGSIHLNIPEEAHIQVHPSEAGFPFNNTYESDFPSVNANYHFRFLWTFGSGSVFVKKISSQSRPEGKR